MEFRLTDVCLSLLDINGSMRKVVKSSLVDCFTMMDTSLDDNLAVVVDMGMLWRLATPNSMDYGKGKFTCGDYATKIFSIINSRHPAAKEFHLVNDRYDVTFSIKDSEHHRRRKKFFQGSKNVFFDAKDEVPPARSFVSFFTNVGNKMRLQEFLFRELQELTKTKNAKFFIYLEREVLHAKST